MSEGSTTRNALTLNLRLESESGIGIGARHSDSDSEHRFPSPSSSPPRTSGWLRWVLVLLATLFLAGCAGDPTPYRSRGFSYVRCDRHRWEEMTRPDPPVFGPSWPGGCDRRRTPADRSWGAQGQINSLLYPRNRGEMMREIRKGSPGFQPGFSLPSPPR